MSSMRQKLRGHEPRAADMDRLGTVSETPIRFDHVCMHQRFYLRPRKFVGICFIKTGEKMSEMFDPFDNLYPNVPRQSFEPDTLVYPVVPDKV